MEPIYIKTDKNGTKIYHDYTCQRCGGHKYIEHLKHVEGGICFACGGTGLRNKPLVIKHYTPEYQAKLDAKREAKLIKELTENKDKINQKILTRLGFKDSDTLYIYVGDTFSIKDEMKSNGAYFQKLSGDTPVWVSKEDLGHIMLSLKYSTKLVDIKDLKDSFCYYKDGNKNGGNVYELEVEINDIPKVEGKYGVGQYREIYDLAGIECVQNWLNKTYWKDEYERLEKQSWKRVYCRR